MSGETIECYVSIEVDAHNVICANGVHQVVLSVWYKFSRDGAAVPGVGKENVKIELVNQETGLPLGGYAEWLSSEQEGYSRFFERREGELGSKPGDAAGYVQAKVYVSHALRREGEGAMLVGARVFVSDPQTPEVAYIGRSEHGVCVHWRSMDQLGWESFQASDPVVISHPGELDDGFRASGEYYNAGSGNLWRSANIYIKFKDPNKSVSKWDYSPSNSYNIYSTRRYGYYETAAYIWPFEGKFGDEFQDGTVDLWFPSGFESYTTSFQPGSGFVITLVSYVRLNYPVYSDDSASYYNDAITIHDELGSPIELYLNQIIPNRWIDIKKPNNEFSAIVLGNGQNQLSGRSNVYGRMKNYQYGYAWQHSDSAADSTIKCDGSSSGDIGYAFIVGNAGNQNGSLWNGRMGWNFCSPGDTDNYGDRLVYCNCDGSAVIMNYYPVWDCHGFCIAYAGQTGFMKGGVSGSHVMWISGSGDFEDRFVWCFEPKW
ncbi:hypothetical protein C0Z18_17295 [Trinickia dabaoshanensis]|uniref:Uncharacterized protein n=1 Tax=Trinickia dabaoshanensis TaxID=564714 RepID=A0A2N7VME0_9BURK|nr:hypothetical protein [Trinickia dabaoshanensis]PMS18332.1 hypothetical protein C0Z18_17295 [Trinickia dabaoshanensis]